MGQCRSIAVVLSGAAPRRFRGGVLKVLKPGMATGEAAADFQAERQALAPMEHSSVARASWPTAGLPTPLIFCGACNSVRAFLIPAVRRARDFRISQHSQPPPMDHQFKSLARERSLSRPPGPSLITTPPSNETLPACRIPAPRSSMRRTTKSNVFRSIRRSGAVGPTGLRESLQYRQGKETGL